MYFFQEFIGRIIQLSKRADKRRQYETTLRDGTRHERKREKVDRFPESFVKILHDSIVSLNQHSKRK